MEQPNGATDRIVEELETAIGEHERDTAAARARARSLAAERVEVRVILTVGDDAQLVTPDHTAQEPLVMPVEDIASAAGLPTNELPGRRFTALRDGGGFRDFRLVDDPRI